MAMTRRLSVGIVGLGRRWQRYRPALLRLRRRFAVRAVFDPLSSRAEAAARHLSCTAAGGCLELLERPDVEAVLLIDRPWFGLWPLHRACALGKPVFCALPLAADDGHAEQLRTEVAAAGLPVLMAYPLACAPALDSLRGLLAGPLGPARLVRADCALRSRPGRRLALLQTGAASSLAAACADLLGTPPVRVSACAAEQGDLVAVLLEGPEGRTAQINLWTAPVVSPHCRIEVVAQQGTATARLPGRLRWGDADGQHAERRPCPPAEDTLLERFAHALDTGQPPRPSFEDDFRSLAWLRAARQSQDEGRPVSLSPAA
jgi:predicted dehydrogenase